MSATASNNSEQAERKTFVTRSLRLIRSKELFVNSVLVLCAVFSILTSVTILVSLAWETRRFFALEEVTFIDFVFGTKWSPLISVPPKFGIWPLICGTLLVTTIAMAVAIPLGLITAIFLSEYAPKKIRAILKPMLEVLAGIPTIVYGFFAAQVISPSLRNSTESIFGFFEWMSSGADIKPFDFSNAMSAGLAVGILCFPTVCSLAEDAMRAVPRNLREGVFALGGTKFDASLKVVFPGALSGIISAILLAVARAIGETMIVALAAGNRASLTFDPRDPVQTMTGFMAQTATGDVDNYGVEYLSMYAVAFTLFLMTLALTFIGSIVRRRYREAYE